MSPVGSPTTTHMNATNSREQSFGHQTVRSVVPDMTAIGGVSEMMLQGVPLTSGDSYESNYPGIL